MNTPPVSHPLPQTDGAVRKGVVSLVLGIVVLICIVGIASRMEWTGTEVNALLEKARWEWILPGWFLMCLAIIALGYRWKALIHPKHNTSGLFLACPLTAAILLNYAIPGPVGELTSAWFTHKKYGLPYEEALASGVAARLFGLCTAALGSGLIWFLFSMPVPEEVAVLLTSGVIGLSLGGLALLLLIHRPTLVLPRVQRLQSRLGSQGFVPKILGVVISFLQALVRTGQLGPKAYLSAFFWSGLGHILTCLGAIISVYGITGSTEWIGLTFTHFTGTTCSAFAFVFPGTQLPWDALYALLLMASAELSVVEASSAVLLLRGQQFAMMALGVGSLLWLMRSIRS